METGIWTNTLSCVLVSTFTSNCWTFMLIRWTTASIKGVFQLSPGPATRENLPRRCTMATCAVSTVKNEPKTALKTKIVNETSKNESIRSVGLIFALLNRSRQNPNERHRAVSAATYSTIARSAAALRQNSAPVGGRQTNMLDNLPYFIPSSELLILVTYRPGSIL